MNVYQFSNKEIHILKWQIQPFKINSSVCTTFLSPASCLGCLLIKVSGYRDVRRKFGQKVKCVEKVDLKAFYLDTLNCVG